MADPTTPELEELRAHLMALAALLLQAERELQAGDVRAARRYLRDVADRDRRGGYDHAHSTTSLTARALASLKPGSPVARAYGGPGQLPPDGAIGNDQEEPHLRRDRPVGGPDDLEGSPRPIGYGGGQESTADLDMADKLGAAVSKNCPHSGYKMVEGEPTCVYCGERIEL